MKAEKVFFLMKLSRGRLFKRLLKSRLFLKTFGMMFPRNHKLFSIFDTKVQQLFEAGLIDHYASEYYKDVMNQKLFAHLYQRGPEVLTLQHLKAGFMVCFVPFSLSVIAFLSEWIIKFKEYLVCNYILIAYFNQQVGK